MNNPKGENNVLLSRVAARILLQEWEAFVKRFAQECEAFIKRSECEACIKRFAQE